MSVLGDLVPRLCELIRSGVGLGTKVGQCVCVCVCVYLFRAAPAAYGGSQARSLIGTIAAVLYHSHSNTGSEPSLQPTPQLTAVPDP